MRANYRWDFTVQGEERVGECVKFPAVFAGVNFGPSLKRFELREAEQTRVIHCPPPDWVELLSSFS
jgi:hypothetical protein